KGALMAGLTKTAGAKEAPPSLPLYLAGGMVVLCGIFAANAAISQPDYVWMTRVLVLSGLGLAASYGARRLRVPSGVLDGLVVGLLLLAVLAMRALPVEELLPVGADKGELRLLAELVWGAAAWTFLLRTDVRVLEICIPVMAALGLAAEVDLNTPVLVCFGVFIVTVIFLLIHQNYLQNSARAVRTLPRNDAEEPRRLLLAQFAQTALCGLAVLLAGLIVIVPAQAVFSQLSLAQAIRRLAAGKATPVPAPTALRFSDEDSLNLGTGDGWTASTEVVMQVTPSDGKEHYWRGRTYDRYTGSRWESTLDNTHTPIRNGKLSRNERLFRCPVSAALTPGDAPTFPAGGPEISAIFRVRGETDQFYGASRPREIIMSASVTGGGHLPREGADGRLDMEDDQSIHFGYGIVSALAPDLSQPGVEARLRRAGTAYPEEVRRLYLPVEQNDLTQSSDVDFYRQAVAEATQDLPPSRQDPLDRALALRQWVSQRCVYSLAVPPIPAGDDHVRAFLNDTRRGYCDMFASSLAILCRTAGIPARLATGFAPGEAAGDSFNLRGADKHAWTEVYFPGEGWVALDATEGSASDGSVPSATSSPTAGLWQWLSSLRSSFGAGWEMVYPLLLIVLALVGYVLKTEVFDRWRAKRAFPASAPPPQAAPRTALGRRYLRLSRALARIGLPRRASETPGEYAARIQPRLREIERETGVSLPADVVPALTAAFTQAAYGSPAAAVSADALEPALRALEAGSRRVWWKTLGRKKKPAVLSERLAS
ncbi:MAG: transglutaminase domain-containing protein, partial [Armatimonadota bacterium]|nr:transglutaminase domain-containing protein [Armatimonadota bacterium]